MGSSTVWRVLGLGLVLGLGGGVRPGLAAAQDDVVRAVLFYSPTCPHCRDVIEDHLPPILERYGSRLEIAAVNTATEGGQALYAAVVLHFDLPRERLGVPALVVGRTVLVGSHEIPTRLPELADAALGRGGIDWPEVPRVQEALAAHRVIAPDPPSVAGAAEVPETGVPAEDGAPERGAENATAAAAAVGDEPGAAPGAAHPTAPSEIPAAGPSAAPAPAVEQDPIPSRAEVASAAEADERGEAGDGAVAGERLLRLETGPASSSRETMAGRFLQDPLGNGSAVAVLVLMVLML